MSLCSRCKELVLATVRAFFDLIDPETRQVRITDINIHITHMLCEKYAVIDERRNRRNSVPSEKKKTKPMKA